jgi:hypothetical protein
MTAPVTPRTVLVEHLSKYPALESSMRLINKQLDAIEREAGGTDALRAALERLVAEYDDDPIRPASWISMKQARAALAASDAGPAGIDWPLVFKAFANAVGLGIVQESQNAIAAEYARLSVLPTSDSESDDKP